MSYKKAKEKEKNLNKFKYEIAQEMGLSKKTKKQKKDR